MKTRILLASLALAALFSVSARAQAPAPAATAAAPVATPKSDLQALVAQVQAKLKNNQRSAADLAPELAAFDALSAKYQGQTTEDVGQIAFMKATLYLQVLKDADRAKTLLLEVKTNFPRTKVAANAERLLAPPAQTDAGAPPADQAALIGKPAPELHFTWATQSGLKTLSSLKGKVVLVDFWATWCGPCIASFPHLRELTAHYKDAAVVPIGVTSIQGKVSNLEGGPVDCQGDEAKEIGLMPEFIKQKEMTWTVAFSEEKVFNPDYGIKGIPSVAVIAPDGTVRHILHPRKLDTDIIDAILKEFKLAVPPAKKA